MYITEKGASELKKIDEKLDIPLSYEPDANTVSIVMKHSMKVNILRMAHCIELGTCYM